MIKKQLRIGLNISSHSFDKISSILRNFPKRVCEVIFKRSLRILLLCIFIYFLLPHSISASSLAFSDETISMVQNQLKQNNITKSKEQIISYLNKSNNLNNKIIEEYSLGNNDTAFKYYKEKLSLDITFITMKSDAYLFPSNDKEITAFQNHLKNQGYHLSTNNIKEFIPQYEAIHKDIFLAMMSNNTSVAINKTQEANLLWNKLLSKSNATIIHSNNEQKPMTETNHPTNTEPSNENNKIINLPKITPPSEDTFKEIFNFITTTTTTITENIMKWIDEYDNVDDYTPADQYRANNGMTIYLEYENSSNYDLNIEKQERIDKTQSEISTIADNNDDVELIVLPSSPNRPYEIKKLVKKQNANESWWDKSIYWLKTKGLDKLIDKTASSSLDNIFGKENTFVKSLDVITSYLKNKKDDTILNNEEQVKKNMKDYGTNSTVAGQLLSLNKLNGTEKEAELSVYRSLAEKNKQAKVVGKIIDQTTTVLKKHYANCSEVEYNLIKEEINHLRLQNVTKEEAIKIVKEKYVNEYYEHYGLESKKKNDSWQDKVLSFMGLGGINRRFGGFNRDKMNLYSSGKYKDTNTRYDMIVDVLNKNDDIYGDEFVEFMNSPLDNEE